MQTPPAVPGPAASRIAGVDIIRGFAIMWVILYHLWTDVRYPNVYPSQADAFRAVSRRVAEGDPLGSLTAVSDAFLRVGYLGVPLFMLLSGLSLTLSAMRPGRPREGAGRFLYRRLRRLMIPYWAGFVITLTFAAALSLVQWQRHGGDGYVGYLQRGDIGVDGGQLFAGALLAPRIVHDSWQFAPEGSLWFVLVLVQYYVLFRPMLSVLQRIGPWRFVAGALIITVGSLAAIVALDGDLLGHRTWIEMAAPFRLFEFALGMSAGCLLVQRPQWVRGVVAAPVTAMAVAAGAGVFIAACLIPPDGAMAVVQAPAVVAGLAFMIGPLIVKPSGVLERSIPGRALAWIGVISYTVLIVSEPLRSVTHTMSAERVSDRWILLWAVAIYLPLTFVLARPLARVLRLIEREPPRVTVAELIGVPRVDVTPPASDHPPPGARARRD